MQRSIGPYLIEERLALGGMAEVFVAKRLGPHGFAKRVSLKRILPQFTKDPDFVSMFIDEARLAARLDHPNIVSVFDFGEVDGELFLAMELVVGTNSNRLLRAVSSHNTTVPLDVVLHIGSQCAHALAYAHGLVDDAGTPLRLVHRDVSPANILLTHTGHVKLGDFGIARAAGKDSRTDDGHVRGKLGYMSPEQVVGRDLDGRSDVFTLSVVLAEMLIAEPLFGTGNDLDVLLRIRDVDLAALAKRQLPKDVIQVLRYGLEKKQADRPTAQELADAIDSILRRRGMVRGPDRTAALVGRLDLVRGGRGDRNALEAGARPTSLLDPIGLATETRAHVVDLSAPAPALFTVEGRGEGPISFPALVQLLTTGAIAPNARVARDGVTFSALVEVPELARFVSTPARQWPGDVLVRASNRGPLVGGNLVGVFHRIVSAGATGLLHLEHKERRKKIYFVDGRPEFVASTDASELFGEFLVASGRCMRMEVDMGLAMMPQYGGRLGDALVGLGILRPVALFEALGAQVRGRYLEAFQWPAGQWAFLVGERSGEEVFPFGHDPREILRDAAAQADPIALAARHAPILDARLVAAERPRVPASAYRLPRAWEAMLELANGEQVSTWMARGHHDAGATVADLHRVLHLGLSCELLATA